MSIIWLLYNCTMAVGFWLYWPWAALKGKRPASWWRRSGRVPADLCAKLAGHPVMWIHAVSVGEAQAIQPLLRQLKARYPNWRLVLTTVTRTGQHIARSLVGAEDVATYFPLDLPWTMRRFLDRVQPKVLLAVETELWPNCFRALHDRGIPVIVINGRLSPRSMVGYRRARFFFQPLLSQVELFLMQTTAYAEQLASLGVPRQRIRVTGNLKWDQADAASVPIGLKHLTQAFGLDDSGLLLVAGSTHPGEEEPLLRTFHNIARDVPHLRCLIAPRHIERTPELQHTVRRMGLEPVTYSELVAAPSGRRLNTSQVVIVDTIGHLRHLYALATVAYVGGSLVPKGGQNPLEPAQFGKPILSGPHVTNFRAIADTLNQAGGLRIVSGHAELETALRLLLASPAMRMQMGHKAQAAIRQNQGAVARTLDAVQPVLAHWAHPTQPCTIWMRGPRAHALAQRIWADAPDQLVVTWMRAMLRAASALYGVVLWCWDVSYRRGWARTHRVGRPVISIGNLTVGGTGKSSCVLWLARQLKARGLKPAIITRGYGRGRGLGDEPALFLRELEDVPVLVGWDRVQSARTAVARGQADILLLDDGFQHRRLARDVDLVTVDAVHAWGNGLLLPRGPLREPVTALCRAHAVAFTKTNIASRTRQDLLHELRTCRPETLVIRARHEARGVWHADAQRQEPVTVLRGARVAALSSIGDPLSFEQLLAQLGATVRVAVRFPDHHRYTEQEVRTVVHDLARTGCQQILTTDKDWIRLAPLVARLGETGVTWHVLQVTFTVDDADAVVDRLLRLSGR